MKKEYLISVDLGGTKILIALFNEKYKIIDRHKILTVVDQGSEKIVDDIAEGILELLTSNKAEKSNVKGISIGVPGAVNIKTGLVEIAPNLNMQKFNITESLENKLGIKVAVENDVNLAALGIKKFELNKKNRNVLVIFVGTGIGGGLILNNKIYRGSNFYAGEIGHTVISCEDEEKTSFEDVASRSGIVRQITEKINSGTECSLKYYVEKNKKIKSKALKKAVANGDKLVISELEKACELIGKTIANVTTLLNLDTIVFGGGVIEAMEKFMIPKIRKAFDKNVFQPCGNNVIIKATTLGDDAPLLGGIALAEEFKL